MWRDACDLGRKACGLPSQGILGDNDRLDASCLGQGSAPVTNEARSGDISRARVFRFASSAGTGEVWVPGISRRQAKDHVAPQRSDSAPARRRPTG